MNLDYWIEKAKEAGFQEAAPIDVATLKPMEMVRDACATNRCGAYGTNWACPPGCGDLDKCREILKQYNYGFLVQTVGKLEKTIDTKGYARIRQDFIKAFKTILNEVKAAYPDAMLLGAGACEICEKCTYPDAPCRFPEKSYSSLESYGIFVTQLCKDNGIGYYYGPKTMSYTGCVLFR